MGDFREKKGKKKKKASIQRDKPRKGGEKNGVKDAGSGGPTGRKSEEELPSVRMGRM